MQWKQAIRPLVAYVVVLAIIGCGETRDERAVADLEIVTTHHMITSDGSPGIELVAQNVGDATGWDVVVDDAIALFAGRNDIRPQHKA